MRKIRDYISYPLRLELAPDAIYRLRSVVVHWGSLEHGHYIAVVGKNLKNMPTKSISSRPPRQGSTASH